MCYAFEKSKNISIYGYIIGILSRDLIRLLGGTKGVEVLVAYAKYDSNSDENEFFSCFVLFFSRSSKVLVRGYLLGLNMC